METPLRVLFVEDSEEDTLLVAQELRRGGYAVHWERVETAEAMAAALDSAPWDLILSDYRMPRFSGPEALALHRDRGLDMPFIMVSGTIGEEQAVASLKAGAHDFLVKGKLARLCPAVERERREAENRRARRKAEAEAREAQEQYRLVLDRMPALAYIASADELGRRIYVSPQVEEMTGYTAEQWIADGELWSKRLHPEDRERVLGEWRRSVAGRAPFAQTYRLLTRDGRAVWWEDAARREVETGTAPPLVLGFVTDVTERKRSEEQLEGQRQALYQGEKLAAMGTLLAGVAHELNNPLGVVVGQANLLRRAAGEGPLAERAEKIERAAERCARIVKNFLALARQHPPERSRAQLNEMVREAAELFAYPLRMENVELELDLDEAIPVLWADRHQLHQVVVNLVTNARQAMRREPPPHRITLRTRFDPARERVLLEVSDDGPGIPPEVRARVFEPFFTTKPPGEGTGLGLALCQGIVESHGGSIRVESVPGQGASFRIDLPAETLPAAVAEAPRRPAAASRESRILVVDDELDLAVLVAEMLKEEGHRVETAGSGAAALEKLAGASFDLVISDVKMPDLDGPGLYLEAQRRHPELEKRFLFFTGDSLTETTRQFLEDSKVSHLAKPFTTDELLGAVRSRLR